MRRILQNKLLTIVILLSFIFIIFIGLTASRRDRVSIFEGVVGNVLNPVQKYLYIGGQRINNFFSFIANISTVKKENDDLKLKNTNLENKVVQYDAVVNENERLKEMIDFKDQYSKDQGGKYLYLGANVIGKGSGNWFDVFIIDKGSNQGIKKYYPVVTGRGLVGQVMEVGPNWSKVLSMVDEKSRVSGTISKTEYQGMIQGIPGFNGEKNCKMMYLPANSVIQKGDFVVTSGLSKFFPKNIKIGVVVEVNDTSAEFVKSAIIKPEVDFTKLEQVLVITNAISDKDYPSDKDYLVEGK